MRIPRKFKLIALSALLLPLCLCATYSFTLFFGSDIAGFAIEKYTEYPNASFSYSGYRVYGSSDWQTHTYVYWTPDDIETVKSHYQSFFPEIKPDKSSPPDRYDASTVVLSNSDFYWFDFDVRLVNADNPYRRDLLDFGYNADAHIALDKLPLRGTIIFFDHSFFAG